MCCYNPNTNFVRLISKATNNETIRERFLADPRETAHDFGFSDTDQEELALYSPRKLRALVEGPSPHS